MAETPDPEQAPRTWMPLVIALSVAVVVVIGAFVAAGLRSGLSAPKASAVEACEAAYGASGEGGEQARIVGGDVYGSAEWRDLRAFLVGQGVVDDGDVPDAEAAARESEASDLAAAGHDRVTVVWWLDSEQHLACTVEVEGDVALDGTVVLRSIDSLADASAG
ncbi:hypothetical protein [Demequina iriomotensis]|uniref:hypothetical protein n=1 Tax=Demequina iriomotensis TaxID=1536641 RepID=UPI000781781B|nr:hypothetical protein [Demequina iriomotensis]